MEPSGDDGDGNTNPIVKSTRPTQLIFHFFTWNNYPEGAPLLLCNKFKSLGVLKYKFQEEIGENGTPHLQGNIQLPKKMRWSEFDLPKTIHWEKTRNIECAFSYCEKDETRNGKTFIYPKPLKEEKPIFTTWINYIIDIVEGEPDRRSIYWIWSEEGEMGKTTLAKYLIQKYNCQFASGGKYTDIMNLIYHTDTDTVNTFLFFLPMDHKNNISYSALESVKDGLVSNMKSYKNGSKIFNRPHIFVFANYPPETSKMSRGRFKTIKLMNLKKIIDFNKTSTTT